FYTYTAPSVIYSLSLHDALPIFICSLDCSGFLQRYSNVLLHCPTCEKTKNIPTALAELITEFQLLFPKRKITTGNLLDWCNNTISRNTIQRFLNKNLIVFKNGRYTYYKSP